MRKLLLYAGLLTPFLYLVPSIMFGFFYPGYDPVAMHASVLGATDSPVASIYNWFPKIHGFTILLMSAGALWTLAEMKRPLTGVVLLFVFGLAMASNGVFPMGSPWHGLYGLGLFWFIAPSILALDLGEAQSSKSFRVIAVAASVINFLYFWMGNVGLDPEGYQGLTQRIFGTLAYAWIAYTAWFLSQDRSEKV